jgi:hypothetical protein
VYNLRAGLTLASRIHETSEVEERCTPTPFTQNLDGMLKGVMVAKHHGLLVKVIGYRVG